MKSITFVVTFKTGSNAKRSCFRLFGLSILILRVKVGNRWHFIHCPSSLIFFFLVYSIRTSVSMHLISFNKIDCKMNQYISKPFCHTLTCSHVPAASHQKLVEAPPEVLSHVSAGAQQCGPCGLQQHPAATGVRMNHEWSRIVKHTRTWNFLCKDQYKSRVCHPIRSGSQWVNQLFSENKTCAVHCPESPAVIHPLNGSHAGVSLWRWAPHAFAVPLWWTAWGRTHRRLVAGKFRGLRFWNFESEGSAMGLLVWFWPKFCWQMDQLHLIETATFKNHITCQSDCPGKGSFTPLYQPCSQAVARLLTKPEIQAATWPLLKVY